ncbi:MAG: DUF1361 domain-containing protein [Firmicutes bacterium]|nr:DUF1361 domain-containing protein [Bacillota bacterium]
MLDKKTFKILSIFTLGYVLSSPLVFLIRNDSLHLMLAWNMLLAFVPFLIVYLINQKYIKQKWFVVMSFGIWLLFLPNTFYLITDLIYINQIEFMYQENPYSSLIYLQDLSSWLSLFHIFFGAIFGIILGVVSLNTVYSYAIKKYRLYKSMLLLLCITILSSFGIYIGRFFRYNSWNFLNLISIFTDFFNHFTMFTIFFITVYTLIQLSLFIIYRNLIMSSKTSKDQTI